MDGGEDERTGFTPSGPKAETISKPTKQKNINIGNVDIFGNGTGQARALLVRVNGEMKSTHDHQPGPYSDSLYPENNIRTLFIHGFPFDSSDREIFNLLRLVFRCATAKFSRTTCHGFESTKGKENLHILRKSENSQNPVTVFAKFIDHTHAAAAIQRLNGFVVCPVRASK